uniref:Uncharacterized protein n=1 Tax=Faecalibaculum rodentium TaxID=1702221 RepID=A0A140DS26_9FIRM|nr:hypothetical protein AALO17_03190 [Faecalibaculum rodentium]
MQMWQRKEAKTGTIVPIPASARKFHQKQGLLANPTNRRYVLYG